MLVVRMEFVSKATLKSTLDKSQGRTSIKVAVFSATSITPHIRRLTFVGNALEIFAKGGPAQWVKVFVPADGGSRSIGRAYTVRRWEPETHTLTIDFTLHENPGPVSAWAASAAAGDEAEIAGPRLSHLLRPVAEWRLFAGDETALSAIASILEALPPTDQPLVFIEVPTPADRQSLTAPHGTRIQWLIRSEQSASPGELLVDAVCSKLFPSGDGQVFLAGEARSVRLMKDYAACLISSDSIDAKGYWSIGRSDYRD
ncbi:siderophore-interacting protein [Telmatospirillum siberiense]|uniref:Siderophore-interacting protein n=2 Tax=Telmatospirillum siberiense TaxID=382514 RepID=A0A2N3PRF6_9PROT|nr:siderophore-interacting protein [Telmatospirillum siberiense]